jgi:hypothetical protein
MNTDTRNNIEHRISVRIGGDDSVLYHIRQTRAPRDYDGFGTIQLADYGKEQGRLVLIRDEHFLWQTGRYESGWFACCLPEHVDRNGVKQELWKRLLRANN